MSTPGRFNQFTSYLLLDRGLSPLTATSYVNDLELFSNWLQPQDAATKGGAAGLLPPPLANTTQIQDYLGHLIQQGITPQSRNRKLAALRAYYRFLISEHQRTDDPTAGLTTLPTGRPLPHTPSLQDIERLLHAPLEQHASVPSSPVEVRNSLPPPLVQLRDALILRFLYATGLRVSELASVPVSALDLGSGYVRVVGKGQKIRLVPIDHLTVKLAESYLQNIHPVLLSKASVPIPKKAVVRPAHDRWTAPKGGPHLFLTRRGQPFTRQGLWLLVKTYAAQVGLSPPPSPHKIRHAFATHLLEGGMGLRTLQLLLGHSDISTTEIYSHVSRSALKETIETHHPRGKKNKG